MKLLPISLLLVAAPAVASAQITNFTLMADQDNTLFESATGDLSNGAGTGLFAGQNGQGLTRRAVVRFNLDEVPPGSVIQRVTLTFVVDQANGGDVDQDVHRITQAWGEGDSVAPGAGGGGGTAAPGDATWIHTFSPSSLWSVPGGDFDPTASATVSVPAAGPVSFDSISGPSNFGLASDVADWINGVAPNHGWLVKSTNETAGVVRRFGSRESTIMPVLMLSVIEPQFGDSFCGTAVPNSSGRSAEMFAFGTNSVPANVITVGARFLPLNTTGFVIASQASAFVMNPGGSLGNLCLGGAISRFDMQLQGSGDTGFLTVPVDLTNFPGPTGSPIISPGDTWYFQAWYLDSNAGTMVSNFTNGLEVNFTN